MRKNIPNLITSCNVMCGTLSIFASMYGYLELAAILIVAGMVFDFFDGFAARLLRVQSEMGKELDSLADVVSFGVAPAMIVHFLIKYSIFGTLDYPMEEASVSQLIICLFPVIIPAFSAYRLAKFNLDTRQTTSFIGMPTPANALFWVALVFGFFHLPTQYLFWFNNPYVLSIIALLLSILLISELPMFSLKLKGFGFKENQTHYYYFAILIFLFIFLKLFAILFIIPLYIAVSAVSALIKVSKK